MKLLVTTPLAVIVETDDAVHVRAEDDTGAFGILRGHADFLTALAISVVTWRDGKGGEHHIAVRAGMLSMSGGDAISVATREAVASDDLNQLESEVLTRFRHELGTERAARMDAERLYLAAMRQIYRHLRPETMPMPGPAETAFGNIGDGG